ncbi:Golgi transport complex subunit 6 [Tilletia horrida]|nr:Golgi transport complex subunit 6 [Tilletia horrida]
MDSTAAATTATAAAPFGGRLRSVLLDPPNPDALRDALAALAHLYPDPASPASDAVDIAGARRNVLDDLDAHLITAAHQLEHAYAPAALAVGQLCNLVDDIVAETQATVDRFERLHTSTATLLTESDSLQKQRAALSWQAEQTDAFLRKFSLNDAELLTLNNPAAAEAAASIAAAADGRRRDSLSLDPASSSTNATSSSHGIGPQFFQVIDRLEQIREDCAELLGLVEEDEDEEDGKDALEESRPPQSASEAVNDAQTLTMTAPLPSSRDPSQKKDMMRAGMNILRLTSEQLNTAHSRLARWCTFEFRQPFKEGVEVSPVMREAVRRLGEGGREDLLGPALSTLTQTRSTALARAFNAALTQGGPPPTYLPRPIELSAHDPIRYIGDMLAWIHQALASEREVLGSLVGVGDDDEAATTASSNASQHENQMITGRRIGQRRRWSVNPAEVIDMMGGSASNGIGPDSQALVGSLAMASAASAQKGVIRPRERLRDLLDRDLEGCCRPLKVRITQTLHSQEGSITVYKLASLISFYSSTMEQTIGRKATLSHVLKELTETAYSAFFANLDRQAAGLMRFSEPPEADLSPPPPLLGACSTLKELLSLHRTSIEEGDFLPSSGNDDTISEEPALSDFGHIIKKLVEPMLKMCDQMAEALRSSVARRSMGGVGRLGVSFTGRGSISAKSKADLENLEQWEVAVFLVNCWSYVSGILESYEFVQEKVTELRVRMNEQGEVMTKLYYGYLLTKSGLAALLKDESAGDKEGDVKTLSPADVDKHLAQLDSFLASPNAVLISHVSLSKVQPAQLRNGVHAQGLERLADAYEMVYSKYSEHTVASTDQATPQKAVMRRTVEEVRLLLGADAK